MLSSAPSSPQARRSSSPALIRRKSSLCEIDINKAVQNRKETPGRGPAKTPLASSPSTTGKENSSPGVRTPTGAKVPVQKLIVFHEKLSQPNSPVQNSPAPEQQQQQTAASEPDSKKKVSVAPQGAAPDADFAAQAAHDERVLVSSELKMPELLQQRQSAALMTLASEQAHEDDASETSDSDGEVVIQILGSGQPPVVTTPPPSDKKASGKRKSPSNDDRDTASPMEGPHAPDAETSAAGSDQPVDQSVANAKRLRSSGLARETTVVAPPRRRIRTMKRVGKRKKTSTKRQAKDGGEEEVVITYFSCSETEDDDNQDADATHGENVSEAQELESGQDHSVRQGNDDGGPAMEADAAATAVVVVPALDISSIQPDSTTNAKLHTDERRGRDRDQSHSKRRRAKSKSRTPRKRKQKHAQAQSEGDVAGDGTASPPAPTRAVSHCVHQSELVYLKESLDQFMARKRDLEAANESVPAELLDGIRTKLNRLKELFAQEQQALAEASAALTPTSAAAAEGHQSTSAEAPPQSLTPVRSKPMLRRADRCTFSQRSTSGAAVAAAQTVKGEQEGPEHAKCAFEDETASPSRQGGAHLRRTRGKRELVNGVGSPASPKITAVAVASASKTSARASPLCQRSFTMALLGGADDNEEMADTPASPAAARAGTPHGSRIVAQERTSSPVSGMPRRPATINFGSPARVSTSAPDVPSPSPLRATMTSARRRLSIGRKKFSGFDIAAQVVQQQQQQSRDQQALSTDPQSSNAQQAPPRPSAAPATPSGRLNQLSNQPMQEMFKLVGPVLAGCLEFYDAQQRHVRYLNDLTELRDKLQRNCRSDYSQIFGNLADVVSINTEFLCALDRQMAPLIGAWNAAIPNDDNGGHLANSRLSQLNAHHAEAVARARRSLPLGQIIVDFAERLRDATTRYTLQFSRASAMVIELRKTNDVFRREVDRFEAKQNGLSLNACLIEPCHRLAKTLSTLVSVQKSVPKDHADKQSWDAAVAAVRGANQWVNGLERESTQQQLAITSAAKLLSWAGADVSNSITPRSVGETGGVLSTDLSASGSSAVSSSSSGHHDKHHHATSPSVEAFVAQWTEVQGRASMRHVEFVAGGGRAEDLTDPLTPDEHEQMAAADLAGRRQAILRRQLDDVPRKCSILGDLSGGHGGEPEDVGVAAALSAAAKAAVAGGQSLSESGNQSSASAFPSAVTPGQATLFSDFLLVERVQQHHGRSAGPILCAPLHACITSRMIDEYCTKAGVPGEVCMTMASLNVVHVVGAGTLEQRGAQAKFSVHLQFASAVQADRFAKAFADARGALLDTEPELLAHANAMLFAHVAENPGDLDVVPPAPALCGRKTFKSASEYAREGKDLAQIELAKLVASPEYQAMLEQERERARDRDSKKGFFKKLRKIIRN